MNKTGILLAIALLAAIFPFSAMARGDIDFIVETPVVEELRDETIEDDYTDGFVVDENENHTQPLPEDDSRPKITSLSIPAEFVIGSGVMEIAASLNMEGQLFLTLFANDMTRLGAISTKSFGAGDHIIEWNGLIGGAAVPAGDYLVQASLKSGGNYSQALEYPLRLDVIIPTAELKSAQSAITSGQTWQAKVNVNQKGKLEASTQIGGNPFIFFNKDCESGEVTVSWDGKYLGKAAPAGKYTVYLKLTSFTGLTHEISTALEIKSSEPPVSTSYSHTSPVVVLNTGEKTMTTIMSKPGGGAVLGKIYGSTVGVSVHGYSGNFAQISARDYDTNKSIKGYVPKNLLRTVEPTPGYVVVIDKKSQRLLVYKNGKVDKTMKCSTGLVMETPNGEFLTGSRLAGFDSHGLWAAYATRFNGSIYYHQVPSKDGNYTRYENQLGKKASAGCVRVPREYAKWLYDNIPKGSKVIVQ